MKVSVPVQQITSVKQKEMSRHSGMNTRIQIKILNYLNTAESFLIGLSFILNFNMANLLNFKLILYDFNM